ncbi:MAG: cation:proton antiporter, partial [Muribaculaceae bacterium]
MLFTTGNILLIGSILLFVSIVVGKTGYRFGVPTLLLFLLVGMLFGSDGLGIQFHNAFEAQFIGMVALCVILFSGGMDTGLREIRPILAPGIVLSTVGVLLTALLTGVFIWWISGMSWSNIYFPLTTSLLLAATMSSTDSASVFAILRSQKINLKHNLRPMLELESGSNDPMAFMLTIVLIQLVNTAGMGVGAIVGSFVVQFAVGALAGYVFGRLAVLMLNRLNIDNQALYPILLLAFVFFTYSFTDLLSGNGYLAVYIAGI